MVSRIDSWVQLTVADLPYAMWLTAFELVSLEAILMRKCESLRRQTNILERKLCPKSSSS